MTTTKVCVLAILLCGVGESADLHRALEARFKNGDPTAIEEAAELPIPEAIHVLINGIWRYARTALKEEHPGYMEKLGEALAEIPGHADVIKERIKELSGNPGTALKRRGYFEVLSVIKSPEAIDVAGSFLFDNKVFQEDQLEGLRGQPSGSNSSFALRSLGKMNLPDAPTKKPFYLQGPEEMRLWRVWWKEREKRKACG